MRPLLLFIIIGSIIIILSGCASIGTMQEKGASYSRIPDDRVSNLNTVVNSGDLIKSDELLDKIESNREYSNDPILLTIRGNIEMLKAEHWYAGVKFREAIRHIKDGKIYASTERIEEDYRLPERRKSNIRPELREDAEIVKSFYNYIHGRMSHRDVLERFRSRSGFVPYPPIFSNSGTPGLTVEVINEQLRSQIIKPRNIQYFNTSSDSLFQVSRMLANLGMNLMTVSLLAMDLEGIEEAVDLLQDIQIKSKETRFYIGLGLYFLGRNNYTEYFELRPRYLFNH